MSVDGWNTLLVLGGSGPEVGVRPLPGTGSGFGSRDAAEESADPSGLAQLCGGPAPTRPCSSRTWAAGSGSCSTRPTSPPTTGNHRRTGRRDRRLRRPGRGGQPRGGPGAAPAKLVGRAFAEPSAPPTRRWPAPATRSCSWWRVNRAGSSRTPGPPPGDATPAGTVPAQSARRPRRPRGRHPASPVVFIPQSRSRKPRWPAATMARPHADSARSRLATGVDIQPGMELPLPDDNTGPQAIDRLATWASPAPAS